MIKSFRAVRGSFFSLLAWAVLGCASCVQDEEPHELTCLQKATLLGARLEPGIDRRGANVLRATSVFLFRADFESVVSKVRTQMGEITTLDEDNSTLTDWFWEYRSLNSEVMVWAD
ncbi:MAG: hypothetical protein EDM74_08495, partial [Armatimonadetes bacterium]